MQAGCIHSDVDLVDVHNNRLSTLGKISLPVKYGDDILDQEFIITSGISEECILGLDAAFKHEFVLDGRSKTVYLSRDKASHVLVSPDVPMVASMSKVMIFPLTAQVCMATIIGLPEVVPPESSFIFTQSNDLPEGISIESFLGETNKIGEYQILVENASSRPIVLPRASTLGSIELAYHVIGKVDISDSVGLAPTEETAPDKTLAPDVDPLYQQPLAKLLAEYSDLFAEKDSQLGSTGLIKHSIDTQGYGPIRLRPYRAARRQKDEMERQIDEMMQANVIRPSTSPWAAPVILVEKKGGEQRFCIDYRKLNGLTKKDSFPLPRIDDTLDMLHGKMFFTTLDLASGYWQIELEESSKEKTAFIVENNLYEFNRMAFGLCNAPATFQRLMNYILRDVLGKKALVYLDDVIIFSDSFDEHLADIRTVLNLIRSAGLRLKRKKCQFIKKSVDYLGHVISRAGIAPDPGKIEKIANYKVPSSAEEVRSFLGLAGYYRRFISNFGSIARPLTAKTHKDVSKQSFTWTKEDQAAFETLRTCLTTSPILAYPNFDLEFLLFTDACDYGIGAVLSQIQDEKEVVIAYFSRQLKPAELKYATVEKEALAVVEAIKHFRHYLLDKPFTVISDHRPLQWLEEQKDNNGRLGRWAIRLASTNYKIKYRPGRIHQNADCLSRLKIANVQLADQNMEICIKQAADPLCMEIRDYLDNGNLSPENEEKMPIWAKEIEFYRVIKGILFRCEPATKKSKRNILNPQVVLPLSLRPLVLKEMHDVPTAGHLAYQRTYLKVKNNYYWPSMRLDIKEYCTACETCIANTKSTLRAYLFPHELPTAPFQVIGMDFLRPTNPPSPNGNRFIMVITDYFSKWVEAVALPNQKAKTTADCLFNHIVQRHGPPLAIVSDRGSNFTSKLFRSFCKTLNIEQRLTTAYNSASNGETERFNRTMTTMLRKELEDGAHGNLEDMLGDVCFAYRASVNSSTLETPYYLLHGRDPNVPINQFLDAVPEPVPSSSDYIGSLVDRLRFSFQRTREENEKARQRQREQYNKRAKLHKYKIGDRVLLDIRVVEKGNNRKFTSKFQGPWRVIRVYSNGTADITDNTYKVKTVHVNRLKPLYETMLWRDEPEPEMIPTLEKRDHFHKSMATQTGVNDEPETIVEGDFDYKPPSPILFGDDVTITNELALETEEINLPEELTQATYDPPVAHDNALLPPLPINPPEILPIVTDPPVLPPLPLAGLQDEPATVIEPLATPYGRTRENLRSKQTLHAPKKFDDYVL